MVASLTCGATSSVNGFCSASCPSVGRHNCALWKRRSIILASTSARISPLAYRLTCPNAYSLSSRPKISADALRSPRTGSTWAKTYVKYQKLILKMNRNESTSANCCRIYVRTKCGETNACVTAGTCHTDRPCLRTALGRRTMPSASLASMPNRLTKYARSYT